MEELVKIENKEIIVASELVEQIKIFQKTKVEMDLKEKELKKNLKEAMEECGIKKWVANGLCATIKDGTIRKTLDSKKLKDELPDVYENYLKESEVASSISLVIGE